MSAYLDIKAKISLLEAKAAEALAKEKNTVIAQIRTLMTEYGLVASDIIGKAQLPGKRSAKGKTPAAPKYRDPVSGKTWTGHGKPPAFIVSADKKKIPRDNFLITAKPVVPETTKVKPSDSKPASKAAKKPTKKVVAKPVAVEKKPVAKASKPKPKAKAPEPKVVTKPATKPAASKANESETPS